MARCFLVVARLWRLFLPVVRRFRFGSSAQARRRYIGLCTSVAIQQGLSYCHSYSGMLHKPGGVEVGTEEYYAVGSRVV